MSFDLRTAIVHAPIFSITNYEQAFHVLEQACKTADVVVAPEWFLHMYPIALDAHQRNELYEKLGKLSAKSLLIPGTFYAQEGTKAFNRAAIFSHGELLFEYDKTWDAGDSRKVEQIRELTNEELTYESAQAPGTFTWNGLSSGIEICADHGMLSERRKKLDLYFLICAGTKILKSRTAVSKSGYAFYSDSIVFSDMQEPPSGVYKKSSFELQKLPCKATASLGEVDLFYYDLK